MKLNLIKHRRKKTMHRDERDLNILQAVAISLVCIMSVGLWYYSAKIESETFNRFTGKNSTTWEAMWSNFRVDCN